MKRKYLSIVYRNKLDKTHRFNLDILKLLNNKYDSWWLSNFKTEMKNNYICKKKIGIKTEDNNKLYYEITLKRQYDFYRNKPLVDGEYNLDLHMYWRITDIKIVNNKKSKKNLKNKLSKKNLKNINIENFSNSNQTQKNINNQSLQVCSLNPLTGYGRDGYCKLLDGDHGTHTVCAKVTNEFLNYSKSKGNDLITPSKMYNFPGLKNGDKWCLCALRWKEAFEAGVAPPVDLKASHKKSLDYISRNNLSKNTV